MILPDQIQANSHCANPGVSGRRPCRSNRWFTLSSAIRRALMGSERVVGLWLVAHRRRYNKTTPSGHSHPRPSSVPRPSRCPTVSSGLRVADTSPIPTCTFWPSAEVLWSRSSVTFTRVLCRRAELVCVTGRSTLPVVWCGTCCHFHF